jgi:hypothetical protein
MILCQTIWKFENRHEPEQSENWPKSECDNWGKIKEECYNNGYSEPSALLKQYYSCDPGEMIDKSLLENCFYYAEKTMNSNCELEDKLEITKIHLSAGREALKYTEGF